MGRQVIRLSLILLLVFSVSALGQTKRKPSGDKSKADAKTPAKAKADATKSKTDARARVEARRAAAKKAAAKTPAKRVTPDQIRRVNEFVAKHIPELSELLDVLKETESRRYEAAIRELYNAVDRLERLKPRDAQGYAMSLRIWKLDKKLQLLAAKIRMDDSMDGEAELKKLLEERYRVDLQLMTRNRDKLAARLKKMDEDIARRKKQHNAEIDRHVRNWTRTGKNAKTTPVRTKKPARTDAKKTNSKRGAETKADAKTNQE